MARTSAARFTTVLVVTFCRAICIDVARRRHTEQQARRMLDSNVDRTAPWLARIVGAVQRAPTWAAIGASPSREVRVDAQQEREEPPIVQEDMTHCDGL